MVEILIGLAITAMLFTALTAAISAGIRSTQANVDYFNTIQRARVTLMKISSDLRDCYEVDLENPNDLGNGLSEDTSLDIGVRRLNTLVAYRWVAAKKELHYFSNAVNATGNRLASNVTKVNFRTQTITVNLVKVVTHVNITMTIVSGGESITLCESVVPRRLMTAK